MPPNIIPGESSGGKHFKLVLEVTPPNVHFVPKVLGLQWFGDDRYVASNDWSKKPTNHAGWSKVTLKERNPIIKQNTM